MSAQPILVAPSLLACDFGHLAEEIKQVEEAGADWLHVDVMDGHFVPNLTIGPVIVEAIRRASRIPLDVHLMLNHPEHYVKPFVDAGAHYLTVHVEAPGLRTEALVHKTLDDIRKAGARPGLSVRPRTTADALTPFLKAVDLMLVMTVEPGFGGQAFMPEVVPKVRQVRSSGFGGHLAVDGGINAQTGALCREAGANVLVAGTYVFRSTSYRDAIRSLRGS
ncbi:MAG: ribulose-phosphate 3-epimerase [Candidatus Omnitrophica bacterium]|nr:ribulose-phosphate 3-epimerase [Candidatus Omnitrophota bacterium]